MSDTPISRAPDAIGNLRVTGQGIRVWQALAIRKGLEFYLRTGMKINTRYTPKNMLATAEAITGLKFGRPASKGRMELAISALTAWLEANKQGQAT